ncbi:hypothetical protein OUZ56_033213 [Daphnia magna]|uniref:Uncharacterized protein n=1 Tax=Daphnia magna TaxID=35525 RepID=A0ABR0BAH2_9CRUS|nr:hypothetical protein OUZ56_033213 [Daphnia magna]
MSHMIFPLPWFRFNNPPKIGELTVVVTDVLCSNWISSNSSMDASGKLSKTCGMSHSYRTPCIRYASTVLLCSLLGLRIHCKTMYLDLLGSHRMKTASVYINP